MRGYLLDTSFITQIVVAELLFGAYKSKCIEENLEQTHEFIKDMFVGLSLLGV